MRDINISQKYSFGTAELSVELNGQYAQLDDRTYDRMVAAANTSLAQLPQWLETTSYDERSDKIEGSTPLTSKVESSGSSIQAKLVFKDSKSIIPQQLADTLVNSITRTIQAHADSARSGVPVTSDPYARSLQGYNNDVQASFGIEEQQQTSRSHQELIGAGRSGSPTRR